MIDVLVPLDGSSLAERVLPVAAMLARTAGGKVRLVEAMNVAVSADYAGLLDGVQVATSDYLNEQARQAADAYGVSVTIVSQYGPAAAIILRELATGGARYVAMSTHARHGLPRAVLGSVAEHVLRESPVPVYLLPATAKDVDFATITHILIPLDGSALSEAVLEPAAVLAAQLGAAVTLIRVYDPPKSTTLDDYGRMVRSIDQEVDRLNMLAEQYMAPRIRRLKSMGVQVDSMGEFGHQPAVKILEVASQVGADLIVMATHGRSGLDRLRHGSVTEEVLRHSELPLLTFGRTPLRDLMRETPDAAVQTRAAAVIAPAIGVAGVA